MIRQAVLEYDHSKDALENLPARIGNREALVLRGESGYSKAVRVSPRLADLPSVRFTGECSDEEVERLNGYRPDVWIAVGGGKLIDTAKRIAASQSVPLIVVPTLVSNCAAFTPLSVIYTEEGSYIRYDTFSVVIERVIADERLLRDSPYDYFKAGVIDTVAKWYEARYISGTTSRDAGIQSGLSLAAQCGKLMDLSIREQDFRRYGTDIRYIVDHVLAIGGAVGGFGDAGTRVAVAHAVHNALSRFDSTHHWLHGDKVGFGLVVQERLVASEDTVILENWLQSIGAPTSLAQLGIRFDQIDELVTLIREEIKIQGFRDFDDLERLKEILINLQEMVYK
ncbi:MULTISPECIES: iron-containing alcohol dehydrogenase [unclassified Exiguobacterium]|uniref:iron-containing alcohol dehydrogenase n=1 Tax=unclassified Exiguobacterium TaxID=2644629 RepID=UPI001BE9D5B6|nr:MULTISPECIES: iron-containing alcohol dehydrogenase [unclassified Exiguobacterium]